MVSQSGFQLVFQSVFFSIELGPFFPGRHILYNSSLLLPPDLIDGHREKVGGQRELLAGLTRQEHFEPAVELGLDGFAGDEGVPQGLDVLHLGRGHLAGEHPELLQE